MYVGSGHYISFRYLVFTELYHSQDVELNIIPARQRSFGKIMFSVMSVCVSVSQEGLMWPLPMIYWASLCSSPPLPQYRALALDPLLVTSGGQDWRPVQTCSPKQTPPPGLTSGHWLLKHVQWKIGRYASYWNAFLLVIGLETKVHIFKCLAGQTFKEPLKTHVTKTFVIF